MCKGVLPDIIAATQRGRMRPQQGPILGDPVVISSNKQHFIMFNSYFENVN